MKHNIIPSGTVGTNTCWCTAHGSYSGDRCPTCCGFSVITFPSTVPGNPEPITFTVVASQAEVDALKLRVAALEARLAALEKTA